MPVCPWCQADVTEVRFPCRSCGRRPKDHVSMQMQAVTASPAEDVPDLALAPSRAPVRPPVAAPTPSRVAAPAPELEPGVANEHDALSLDFGKVPSFAPPPMKGVPGEVKRPAAAAPAAPHDSFDSLDFVGHDGAGFDLDMGPDAAAYEAKQQADKAAALAAKSGGAKPGGAGGGRPGGEAAEAPGSTLLGGGDDGGRKAAEALGAYGDAPAEWWKAPVYAYRVKVRQLDLRRGLAARRIELDQAQEAVDNALIVLAERGRKLVESKDSYAKRLDAVIVAETDLKARDSALATETEAHHRQTAGLDERIAQREAELAGARAEAKAYANTFDRADAIRQRADAKVKRLDIELRSAQARAAGSAVGGSGGAEVTARTAERDERVSELEQSMPAVLEATQKLTAARRKVATLEGALKSVKNERAALEEQFRKRGAAHGAQVVKAQKAVRVALAALGRAAALDLNTFGAEWTEQRNEIASLDRVTTARDDEVMLHVMALDAYERKTVQTGVAVVGGLVGLMVVLMSLAVFLTHASAPLPPPPAAVSE
jgi:hypothetical protein